MEWLYVNSVEELKKLGKLKAVMSMMRDDIEQLFKDKKSIDKNIVSIIVLKSNSWIGLYQKIAALREVICSLRDSIIKNNSDDTAEGKAGNDNNSEYFISREAEYIFYLLELDGKQRADKLNITMKCYSSKKEAKKWRDSIAKIIYPDRCKSERAHDAMCKLQQLYEDMVGVE